MIARVCIVNDVRMGEQTATDNSEWRHHTNEPHIAAAVYVRAGQFTMIIDSNILFL